MRKVSLLLIILGLLNACANHNTVRQHADAAHLAQSIASIVILPADMEINRYELSGESKPLSDAETRIQKQIYQLAKNRLEQEGLIVIEFDLQQEAARDPLFAQSVARCKAAWNDVKRDIYSADTKQRKNTRSFQASLGPVTQEIYHKTGADAVLLMHYRGTKRSTDSKIFTTALSAGTGLPINLMQKSEGATLDIALVATTSGQVIWANRKNYGIIDGNPAVMALDELPDVDWQSEIDAGTSVTQ
ncbi:hypothetical protein [Simiduia agarivorans]|uniref:Lipoprotein n=1 Tax=Simiduia agarivorans (strain DSM 21679 / JCM 13881 / BCRC 17597 / SA1) TaxID=1117647 RepID=K4KQ43_SIMAS|nr:hypothetical protein [Simiduia agarivorans]AFV00229.1 hypothetical protein M5M_15480 [Simiduia agarivorans SA1 = DSM 21679]